MRHAARFSRHSVQFPTGKYVSEKVSVDREVERMGFEVCSHHRNHLLLAIVGSGGLLYVGYKLGQYWAQKCQHFQEAIVSKSQFAPNNAVLRYCRQSSTADHPVQVELLEETMKLPMGIMLGAPEVLALNTAIIKAKNAEKILDVGVFTGASSLASALANPRCKVIACDLTDQYELIARKYWSAAGVQDRIQFVVDPASKTLDNLIAEGQACTFDFAFVDADKTGYQGYYEQCMELLKSGGVVVFDNTLWSSKVLPTSGATDSATLALRKFNEKLASDPRSYVVQLNIGDGVTVCVKK